MKKIIFCSLFFLGVFISADAQLKKDGTPDMRYKVNKEMYSNSTYGNSNTTSNYNSIYQTPSSVPSTNRNYQNGGQIRMQNGYMKSNGTYVQPHIKTRPDNNKMNNLNNWYY